MFMRMIYDEKLAQAAYVIGCLPSGEAVVIDPERDVDRYIDLARGTTCGSSRPPRRTSTRTLSAGARELAERVGAQGLRVGRGRRGLEVQWLDKVGVRVVRPPLLKDGDTFSDRQHRVQGRHTPGTRPSTCVSLSPIMEPGGSRQRADRDVHGRLRVRGRPRPARPARDRRWPLSGQMEPGARRLFKTAKWLSEFPSSSRSGPAHGAGSACGKALGAVPTSTVGYEKRFNPAIRWRPSPASRTLRRLHSGGPARAAAVLRT